MTSRDYQPKNNTVAHLSISATFLRSVFSSLVRFVRKCEAALEAACSRSRTGRNEQAIQTHARHDANKRLTEIVELLDVQPMGNLLRQLQEPLVARLKPASRQSADDQTARKFTSGV